MKCLFTFLCMFLAAESFSQNIPDPVLEVGLTLGEPTGICAKYWLTNRYAFDAGAGWSSTKKLLDIYLDYQYHYFWSGFFGGELPVYMGGGAMVELSGDFYLGVRLPLGAEYLFEGPRIVLFAQVAPAVKIIPKPDFFVAGGLGIRYAF